MSGSPVMGPLEAELKAAHCAAWLDERVRFSRKMAQ